MSDMDPVALRRFVYDTILSTGRPPTARRVGENFGVVTGEATRSLAELRIGKTILVHPKTGEIWMAGPFAADQTDYRVDGARATWFANCAWDMLGIAIIANEPVRIAAKCADCGLAFAIDADPARGVTTDWLVHFLLPARKWYDDIGFT